MFYDGKYIKKLLRIYSYISKKSNWLELQLYRCFLNFYCRIKINGGLILSLYYKYTDSICTWLNLIVWTFGEILYINEVNWNILLALGEKIKRDNMSSVSESIGQTKKIRSSLKVKWIKICLNTGEPSSKTIYDI